jgi:hypothetical protein
MTDVLAIVAIALVAFITGIGLGFRLHGNIIDSIAQLVAAHEASRREAMIRQGFRPREVLRSGAMSDEDPRSAEEREQLRREQDRVAKIAAGEQIRREREMFNG